MAERREDISVRMSLDYAKALADMQRFTGSAGRAFDELPKVVQGVGNSVDRLNERIERMGGNDGPDQLRRRLGQVNSEASALSKTFDKLATGGKAIGAAMAGWQAGKMVMAPHLEKMMRYEDKLADLTNLANSDKDVAGRLAAMPGLNTKIMGAIQGNGGDRDAGLEVYQKILGAGPFSKDQADVMAPTVMRGATASGAQAGQIADIGIAAVQNMGFKDIDLPKIIGMSIKSGDLGGFELGKMAQYLPAQMGVASETLGMKGSSGYAQLLTMNQAAMLTEKNADKAANNVANLLGKMTSSDTLKDFDKKGINLTKAMQDASAHGGNPVAAFMQSVEKVMSGNKEYQALNKKLGNTKDDGEQNKILEQQRTLLQGAGIGTVLQDMQARMAYFGLKKMGTAEFERQTGAVQQDPTKALDTSFGVKSSTLEFSRQQRLNAELNAQNDALTNLNPALKTYNDWVTKLSESHPVLTTAMEGGKIAVSTLAAGAGAASLVMQLLGKNANSAAAALGGVTGGAGGGGAGGGGGGGGGGLSGGPYGADMGKFGKAMNIIGALSAGWEIGTLLNNHVIDPAAKWVSGGKSDSLGGLIFDLTHKDEMAKNTTPSLKIPTFSESVALKKQAAFNQPVSPIALPPAANTAQNQVLPASFSLPPAINATPNMAMQKQTAQSTALPSLITAEPGTAIQKQLANPGANNEALQRALVQGLKPLPLDARLKVDVSFNEMNKPYVAQQSLTGKGIRLDTGPMMTH